MKKLTIVVAVVALFPVIPATNAAVFAEVATASYCPDCPSMNEMLFDIYSSHEYDFYYVAMVGDRNEFAYDRIKNDYNFYWYPTVFMDGGYRVLLDNSREGLERAIKESMNRKKPDIDMEVSAEWAHFCCGKDGFYIETHVRNLGDKKYEGVLRVYIAEINSRWDDYSGNQYHFAFLGFADINAFSLDAHKEDFFVATWIPGDYYTDIGKEDVNNIAIFSVLFNATPHTQYANPPDGNPFNAHYVDAVAAYLPENVPPSVSIVSPRAGYLYIFNRELFRVNTTIIIGSKTVEMKIFDESGIDRVEIYEDGVFKATLEEPYQWEWRGIGRHVLRAEVYDSTGLNATDSVEAFLIG